MTSVSHFGEQVFPDPASARARRRGLLGRVVDLFSSIWLGVVLAVLLFLYCTIGSAIPAVRQHPLLEMTEFEWFHWWPFDVLIALFTLNMVVATVRRVPLRLAHLGVWMVHGGIVVLALGSYEYFSTKVEGDTPVFRRRVTIRLPGMDRPTGMVALPGSETRVPSTEGVWRFAVQSTNTAWPILSEPDKGKRAYAVNVLVTPPQGDPFIRLLLDGYPQYTEDILPGKGRAIKTTGKKLVREELSLSLDYEPQDFFYLVKSRALYVRRQGDRVWRQRPIRGLPRYHDRVGSREQVFTAPHFKLPLRAIDLAVPAVDSDDPLREASVRITGYLRYAHMERRWREGGERLNPVVRVRLRVEGHRSVVSDLAAFDRTRKRDEQGLMEFLWLDRADQVKDLPLSSAAKLSIEVPDAKVSLEVPITREKVVGPEGPFTEIEGTPFSYRIRTVQDDLVLPGGRGTVSVAIVDIRTPEGRFTRWVADQPGLSRDLAGDDADGAHGMGGGLTDKLDPRVRMRYVPQRAPILLAGYPGGLHLVVNRTEGKRIDREIEVGEWVEVAPGLSLRAESLLIHAREEIRPFIVPPASRDRDAGETFSMIRLEVADGGERQVRWVPFHQYALPSDDYAYAGRFRYAPVTFRAPDGTTVEVIFSRERLPLPAPVALEDFQLDTHIGGYTGQALTIRNYISKLRFLKDGKWTEPRTVRVNGPTEFGGYWYFQSMWDKPPNGMPQGGMNYTGLGVGNRNGVYVQLFGASLAVAGMIFSFYIKPVLRRKEEAREAQRLPGTPKESVARAPTAVPVGTAGDRT